MKLHPHLVAVALLLSLTACVSDYSETEAEKGLTLNNASARIDLRFAPGSSQLLAGDLARLRALAASGRIASSDRITVAVGGGPGLARARFNALAAELLPYRIVVREQPLAGVPANGAIIEAARYLVTNPACPDWSKYAPLDYSNTHPSNWGCSNAINLGLSVWSPADLVEGRPVGLANAIPAAAAVQRYEGDKVVLPSAAAFGPITAPSAGATGAGATGAGTAGSAP